MTIEVFVERRGREGVAEINLPDSDPIFVATFDFSVNVLDLGTNFGFLLGEFTCCCDAKVNIVRTTTKNQHQKHAFPGTSLPYSIPSEALRQ